MNEETKRKECLDQRNSYIKDLSTGSFGLSFIFVDKIVQDTIQRSGILVYSWVMFACSVICCLLSFICSKAGFKKAIEEIDEQIENPKHKFDTSLQDLRTSIFNVLPFVSLIFGFASFILFAYNNLMGE